jgi:Na+/H+-dicarboxylate symporter
MKLALAIAPVTAQFPAGENVARELPSAVDFLLGLIPANPFAAAASGALLPLVVFVVLFGAAAGALPNEQRAPLLTLAEAITAALIRLVHWILWTAPVGVFALAAPMVASSGWAMLQSLAVFILAVAVGLAVFVAAVYAPLVVVLGGVDGRRFIRALIGPVAIGAGSTSSAAALPAMLDSAQQELGVSQTVAGLVLSLGTAMNRAGSALFQGAAIIFLAALYDVQIPLTGIAGVVLATFLVSLTIPAVPSASLVTLAPAMDAAGIPLAGIGVLFGIDRIPDMLRTGVNIIGHMTTTVVIEPLARESKE